MEQQKHTKVYAWHHPEGWCSVGGSIRSQDSHSSKPFTTQDESELMLIDYCLLNEYINYAYKRNSTYLQ